MESVLVRCIVLTITAQLCLSLLASKDCPSDFDRFDSSCYFFSNADDQVTWSEALQSCLDKDSFLLDVTSEVEDAYVKSRIEMTYGNVWIGATDLEVEGSWVWNATGDNVTIVNVPGQEENDPNRNCLVYRTRRQMWFDIRCNRRLKYICEMDMSYVTNVCPTGHIRFEDSCYQLRNDELRWVEAAQACLDVGAYLAEVTTEEEDDFLLSILEFENGNIWLGGTDMEMEGNWTWLSGQAINFTSWRVGQPDNRFDNEHCLAYRTRKQMSFDVDCNRTRPYICESFLPSVEYVCYPNNTIIVDNSNSTRYHSAFANGTSGVCVTTFSADFAQVTITGCQQDEPILVVFSNRSHMFWDIIGGYEVDAYLIKCSAIETGHTKTIANGLNPTLSAEILATGTITPSLTSSLRMSPEFGAPAVTSATMTTMLFWTIDVQLPYYVIPNLCTVYSGTVVSSSALNKVLIVDGCTQDSDLVGNFASTLVNPALRRTYAQFFVFKFYDSDFITLECTVTFCLQSSDCTPDCASGRRRRADPKDYTEEHVAKTTLRIIDASPILSGAESLGFGLVSLLLPLQILLGK